MFVGITNTPRDYAWGSTTAIAELLGRDPSGGPEAELWLGAHPGSPSRILAPASVGGHETLDAWIAADPARTLGAQRAGDRLPFLLKVLAADEPLSIQAHPSIEQAQAGYAAEDEAGVAVDAADRNYKDELHKPEMTLALSETFDALAGFRDLSMTLMLLNELAALAAGSADDIAAIQAFADQLTGDDPLRNAVGWAFGGSDEAVAAIEAVARISADAPAVSSFTREYATLADIGRRHPGDPGVLVALLLNRVAVPQGQAVYLPSGNVHAYLRGLAIEIMASSDNVLRGGLTAKHVDVDELLKVVRWESLPAPYLIPEDGGAGVEIFRPDVPDFALARVTVGESGYKHGYQNEGTERAYFTPSGPAIILVVEGELRIDGQVSTATLLRGESSFVTPDEGALEFSGSGIAFVATTNA
ncbi:mannose-6-phosphate isomerase, class I [Herbiconiux sp. L3-i23]|uniref:mannose-6-phosphate isomerase, class I n=1 Tax=Herbiconiux sp. L3-i23 TaxID=2905871 RepID=UPI0020652702|nr:mannose-6-phosphate isomerase, class I [Herbiconiux sp. L3-i23]BDI21668.1 mannose-6-phosphate isomerase, class I [Herbiconiux sp. L3-i23]